MVPRKRIQLLALVVIAFAMLTSAPTLALTLAVTYFANQSGSPEWQPFATGLADMLITELATTEDVIVVERTRLQVVLEEIKLASGGYVDPATAQRLGRGLGATHVLIGSFAVRGGTLRIDARAIEVATGIVGVAAASAGPAEDAFAVVDGLAEKLRARFSLGHRRRPSRPRGVSAGEVRTYGEGLDALNDGDVVRARRILETLALRRPDFVQVRHGADEVSKKIARLTAGSKHVPERVLALAQLVGNGQRDQCGPLMAELERLRESASRAVQEILRPAGGKPSAGGPEDVNPLMQLYAVTMLLLERPVLSEPICPGNVAPAGISLVYFLISAAEVANLVAECDPDRLAMQLTPESLAALTELCRSTLPRVPGLHDGRGRILVAAADYPMLMAQLGGLLVQHFPDTPNIQGLLRIIGHFIDHIKFLSSPSSAKRAAKDTTAIDIARRWIHEHDSRGGFPLIALVVALDPNLAQSIGAGARAHLHLVIGNAERDLIRGLSQIEISVDRGGQFPYRWPLKTESPGYAAPELNLNLDPAGRLLVGVVTGAEASGSIPTGDIAGSWYAAAAWLGSPWTDAEVRALVFRLLALDGIELARCAVQTTSDDSAIWGKVACKRR